jgi:hypothetical protein
MIRSRPAAKAFPRLILVGRERLPQGATPQAPSLLSPKVELYERFVARSIARALGAGLAAQQPDQGFFCGRFPSACANDRTIFQRVRRFRL